MPTTQEFTLIVDQSTIDFIRLIVKLFLALALGLAFMFSFVVAMLYCSAKLLIFGYSIMYRIVAQLQAKQHRKNEVIS
jgi:hypothetical protein